MLDELLRETISITVGKGTEPIADLLNSTKYQNEFNLAKKLGITINQTRNILYKISDFGLVVSERKKDKKKGWYTYYWKFDIMKSLEFLKKRLLESKEKFEVQINRREGNQFYVCEYCNLEYSEEDSLLMEFTCDECGELLSTKDNSTLIKGLKKNLEKIEEKLEIIEVEIAKEQKKLDKKKAISVRIEEEEKEQKKLEAKKRREERKKERDKEKAKLKEENEKKNPKKKVATTKKKVAKAPAKKKTATVTKKKVVKKKPLKKVAVKSATKKVSTSKKKIVKKKR
jgi:transcription factor E